MDPLMFLGGGLFSAIFGGLGELFSGPQRAEAERLLKASIDEYGQVDLPKLQDLLANLPQDSELAKVRVDPRLREAQMGALDRLGQIDKEGGLTLSDKAALNQVMNQTARTERAGMGRIQEQMDARGVGNSGATLAMMLKNQQNAAERANQAGTEIAGMAQQRAMDAIMQKAGMAGKIRAQDYGEQADLAKARDLIKRYNADRTYDAHQQGFNNRMRVLDGKSRLTGQLYDHKMGSADRTSSILGGVGRAGGGAMQAYGGYRMSRGGGGGGGYNYDDNGLITDNWNWDDDDAY